MIYAISASNTIISGKGLKEYIFPFDNATIFGDVTMQTSGDLITIYGRVNDAVYLRLTSYMKSVIPFYHECFSNPGRCVTGFTVSFWMFLRPTYSTGHIVNAYNSGANHGWTVTYTTNVDQTLDIHFSIVSPTQRYETTTQLPPRTWSHLACSWGTSNQIWVNGTNQNAAWTTVASTIGTEGDVTLVFGTDSDSFNQHSDMAIDEFNFQEQVRTDAAILAEFGRLYEIHFGGKLVRMIVIYSVHKCCLHV